jgi:dTDP-4-amino-4,6-dideoxygalactose transaminase
VSDRAVISARLLRAYVRDDRDGRTLPSVLERAEAGCQELWITGVGALVAAIGSDDRGCHDRLSRVLRVATLLPVGAKTASTVVENPGSVDDIERGLVRNLRGAVALVIDPAGWGESASTVDTFARRMTAKVPLVDLTAQLATIGNEINDAIWRILSSSAFILGHEVTQFEAEYSELCGGATVVGVNSGTDAIHLGLRALGIGDGDAVITSSFTFIATAEAVAMTGARPLFVDIDDTDYTMCPVALERWLARRAMRSQNGWRDRVTGLELRAIMPVHLHGQPACMERINPIAEGYGLAVLEDACQAHGAEARMNGEWKRAGTLADGAAFSFFPGKNLGAYGDAGAFTSRRADVAASVRKLRDHGRLLKYEHEQLGWNSRLDALQAAILRVKLKHLDEWTAARRMAARHYNELLKLIPAITLPFERDDARHVFHLYVLSVPPELREPLMRHLAEAEIDVGIHYPIPVHRQPAASGLNDGEALPSTDSAAKRVLSLPIYAEISQAAQTRIAETLSHALLSVA